MVKNKHIFLLVLAILLLKLGLLPFSQTTDADAVTRIFSSIHWKDNPVWIKTDVWGPFHYYLNGLALMVWENRVLAPKVLNIILSCITLLVFYFFVQREFNKKGAFYATLYLAFCPVLFKTSFLGLSNTPFLLFLVLTMNFLSIGMKKEEYSSFIFAGLFITIASGFRYEAWLIMAIFGVLLLVYKKPRQAILFGVFAGIFPVIWMISNWMETGNALYSINGNYVWTHDMMGINENLHWKEYVRRFFFFPNSWVMSVGFLACFVIITKGFLIIKNKDFKNLFWLVPFLVIFLFMIYNSIRGNLLNHHRFTGTLVVFSLPFIAIYFENYTKKKSYIAITFLVFMVVFSFFKVRINKGNQLFPRLKNRQITNVQKIIDENIKENEYIIIDFIDWEDTYYLALNSRYHPSNVYIQEGAKYSTINKENFWKKINSFPTGLLVYKKNSGMHQLVNSELEAIEMKNIANVGDIYIVQLRKKKTKLESH